MILLLLWIRFLGGIFLIMRVFGGPVQLITTSLNSQVILPCDLDFLRNISDPFTIHWFKEGHDGAILTLENGKSPIPSSDFLNRLSVLSSTSLLISRVSLFDLGFYECRATVRVMAEIVQNSSWALLEMKDDDLHFTLEPVPVLLIPGQTFRLECATSQPALIKWRLNGAWLQIDRHQDVFIENNSLILKPIDSSFSSLSMSGFYQCVATYGNLKIGTRLVEVNMAVLDSYSETNDLSVSFNVRSDAVIPCSPPPSLPPAQLSLEYVNGTRVELSNRFSLLPGGLFRIRSVKSSDAASFRCIVYNSALNKSQVSPHIIHLLITSPAKSVPRSPQLLATPLPSFAVALGCNLTFECVASGFPFPNISWIKYGGSLHPGRYVLNSGSLTLLNVSRGDEGTYVCQAANGAGPPVSAYTFVDIEEPPHFLRPLINQTVNEGDEVTFECDASGVPRLSITWLHNSLLVESDDQVTVKDRRLSIHAASLDSGGFYQCYAVNQLGVASSTARLYVLPQPHDLSEIIPDDMDNSEHVTKHAGKATSDNLMDEMHNKRKIHKSKKTKTSNGSVLLVPPTRPQVTKLSDESVMIRWDVPSNEGLPILFFKVQYKDVSKSRWMTIDDEIAAHIHSFEVSNLRTGRAYRFRVAAVYSNHDNNQGPVSAKFLLQKEPRVKKPLVTPPIVQSEALNSSAILLIWQYTDVDNIPIEGFFVYYRATTTAAYYLKATVIGANTRMHMLMHLLPDTVYEIKIQCFNVAGTSDFSNILTQKTMKSEIESSDVPEADEDNFIPVSVSSDSSRDLLHLVLGVVVGSIVSLVTISFLLCKWKQKKNRRQLLAALDKNLRGNSDNVEMTDISTLNSQQKNNNTQIEISDQKVKNDQLNGEIEL